METKTKSFPQVAVIMGNVVSIVVAPPAQIGANRPNTRTNNGAPNKVKISRKILLIRAIVPNSAAI